MLHTVNAARCVLTIDSYSSSYISRDVHRYENMDTPFTSASDLASSLAAPCLTFRLAAAVSWFNRASSARNLSSCLH
jgi:hypothetical protein